MNTNQQMRVAATTLVLALLAMASIARLQAQTVLFSDTFDRADDVDIDASSMGMSGLAAPMTYLETDSQVPITASNLLTQVTNNTLYLAFGPNASVVGLESYNFTNNVILADGGFSISMDVTDNGNASDLDRWCGFGVGLSADEIANLQLDYNSTNGPRGRFNHPAAQTGVADFFVDWSPNVDGTGSVQIFTDGTAPGEQIALTGLGGATSGTLRANFYPADFNSGSTVTVEVYFNDNLMATRNFSWSHTGANYIALSCRQDGGGMAVDNLQIQTIIVTNVHAQLFWAGDGGANEWNSSSLNWSNLVLGVLTNFATGDDVVFGDSTVNTNVNIVGTVSPDSITMNNSANDYTFNGGVIGGSGGLAKLSAGTLTMNLGNTYSGGTVLSSGRFRMGTDSALGGGLLTLSGGTLSSVGANARTLSNPVLVTSASGLGDATDNGTLTLHGLVDYGGGARRLTVNSDAVFDGGATNGRVGSKQGMATLTIKGLVEYNGASDVQDGTLVYDGATVHNSDRIIADAGAVAGIARLVFTNGATLVVSNTGGNLRAGRVASTGSNYVDVAGYYDLPNADVDNGKITLQGDAAYSEMTFWPGGDVAVRSVTNNNGVGNTVFNFDGGILRARNDTPNFFEGLSLTYVRAGGAIIDDGGFDITINQALMDGGGGGGLTKLGSGTLTLGGFGNNYTGSTVVSNGTLTFLNTAYTGGSGIFVADGAGLGIVDNSSSLSVPSITLGSSGASVLSFDLPNGNPFSAQIVVGSLTANGSVAINVTGNNLTAGQFTLMQFTSGTGLGNFHLGTVEPGVTAILVKTANTIDLQILSVVKSLTWAGSANNQWDTGAINWYDLNNANNPTNYTQAGGYGDMVSFSYFAISNTDINIASTVTPVSMTVDGAAYRFSGPGKLSGGMTLTEANFASLTLATANDYTGGTVLDAGNLYIGNDQALGAGALTFNLGILASDGAAARTISNSISIAADTGVTLGDIVNNGVLTLAGTVDLNGSLTRTLNLNSDVVVSGMVTNGGFGTKFGPGRLAIAGVVYQDGLVNHQQGDVIIDGGWLASGNGWRMQNNFAGTTLLFAITNGGLFTLNRDSANIKVGLAGGDASATNVFDISGTCLLYSATGNGRVDLGASGAKDILNLRSGGLLSCRRITSTSPGDTEVNLDGGTLMPIADEAAFMEGLTNVFIQNGGVTVDTTNFNISISQPLLVAGTGGLNKTGTGRLLLDGANTYTGTTLVSQGTLGGNGTLSGPVRVASGATLVPGAVTAIGTLTIANSLTLSNGSTVSVQVNKDDSSKDLVAGLVDVTYGGTLTVSNIGVNPFAGGETFQLFSASGAKSGNFSSIVIQPSNGATGSFDPASGTLTISVSIPTTPTNLTFSATNGNLNLSWPSNYLGWSLQMQSSSLAKGLSTNWTTIVGSESVTSTNFPINGTNGAVFYRLFYQAP